MSRFEGFKSTVSLNALIGLKTTTSSGSERNLIIEFEKRIIICKTDLKGNLTNEK